MYGLFMCFFLLTSSLFGSGTKEFRGLESQRNGPPPSCWIKLGSGVCCPLTTFFYCFYGACCQGPQRACDYMDNLPYEEVIKLCCCPCICVEDSAYYGAMGCAKGPLETCDTIAGTDYEARCVKRWGRREPHGDHY